MNEQDRPTQVRYAMEHQEEKRACSNLQSLRRPCLLCLYTMELTNIAHESSVCVTEYLIAARAVVILWTNLAVVPAEIVFDAIEAELERRGIEL